MGKKFGRLRGGKARIYLQADKQRQLEVDYSQMEIRPRSGLFWKYLRQVRETMDCLGSEAFKENAFVSLSTRDTADLIRKLPA